MNWAELSYELGRVVLVRDFIGPSGLVRVVFWPSCPAAKYSHEGMQCIDFSKVAKIFYISIFATNAVL